MSKLLINIGTTANDQSGDSLRTAFNKINQNFTELYNADLTGVATDRLVSGISQIVLIGGEIPYVTFPATGKIRQNRADITTLTTSIPNGVSAVIHTANSAYTSYKLIITVEGSLDGDVTSTRHTQTCEATIAAIYNSAVEPVMSVYGIIYTSPTPLVTFTVRRGALDAIEVVALNSQALETLTASVHAVSIVSTYD